jgi:hypothetical protein
MPRIVWSVLACLMCLTIAAPARAQFDSSSVLGTVRDKSGAIVADAKVTITNTATGVNLSRTTDVHGGFEFPNIRVGVYLLTAEKSGFAMAMAENVGVNIGTRQRVDLVLEVGALTESVQVSAASPALETDSSQRGQVITGAQTRALPLNGREYSSLALLTTGVRASALNTGGTPREGSFNVNGLRSTFNNFLIDGVDNNAYGTSNQGFSNQVMQPPPDAVAEFRVVTNNMSAEFGRSGGATVNVAYAAGTNAFRGSAWEFVRDTSLNATGFFKPASGEKPPLERNQYGGVFGGPLARNRAFFFADFEGFRQTRGAVSTATIATLAQRDGIFTVPVRNPLTDVTYAPGTPVPMTALARKVLSELPAPTNGNAANNYQILARSRNETDKASGKVDMMFSPSASGFARFGWRDLDVRDDPSIPLPSGGGGNGQTYVRNKQFATGVTWTRGSDSVLEMRFGWSQTQAGKNPPGLGSDSAQAAYGIDGLPDDARVAGGFPNSIITGYTDLGRQATNPQWQYPTVFNPKINYTTLRGRHSLKGGYEFQHVRTEVQDVNPLYGRDTYGGQLTRPAGAAASTLYNLADFMLGLRTQYALSNILIANLRQNMHFAYVQDDVRASDRLTVNLGVRYEYATPHWERDDILSNWDPATKTMIRASGGSLEDRALVKPDRNNFAPRVGLAYSLTPRTVLRGGYGISYVHFHRAGGANLLPINGPQVINAVENQTNALDPAFRRTEQGYPAGFTDPARFDPLRANITYMPRDYHASRVQSWFASAQRDLGRNMVVDVAYVGNRADGLLLFANLNQAAPNNSAGTIPLQARRPIPEFADITYSFNGGYSRYHAFQAKFDWRLRADLSLLSSLTLSRTIDNGSGSLENQNGNAPAPQDFYNMAADEGLSNYHQPYNSTTSFVWQLPIGRGRKLLGGASPLLDALVGGWQLAGINTFYAGAPVTFTYQPGATLLVSGIQQDFRGANNYRPNVIGDPLAPEGERTIANYFNRSNVVLPADPSQPFGNAERNSVRGPRFWQIDFAASKYFPMPWPAGRLEFRVEAFNVFNHTNFQTPNGNRSAGGFGTITSAFDARQIQFGVKVAF